MVVFFSSKLVRREEIGGAQIKDAPLQPGRQNSRRGILGRAHAGIDRSGGMRTPNAIHLRNAAKLSNRWWPSVSTRGKAAARVVLVFRCNIIDFVFKMS